ncbi:MAG TPA: DDE-type integrase/transposase/recombinase [Planctomycetota bacterium]|nr:DDE-type integrase/transposase/recombinase [Planctomycetota bacterium]
MTYSRAWCANGLLERVRFKAELLVAQDEIALLKEEIRIKDARLAAIEPKLRPLYPPAERMAILELQTRRGWSLAQTARVFHLTAQTVARWLRRLDEDGPEALVQVPVPVNKFPDLVRHTVQRLKTLCPQMGKKQIAQTLARAGLHLAVTTVGRMRKEPPVPPPQKLTANPTVAAPPPLVKLRTLTSKYPGHLWNIDLTLVPTLLGFWLPMVPFALLQRWPFCWWVAVAKDHFSRKIMQMDVFKSQPSARRMGTFLKQAVAETGRAPKHLITDQGGQFKSTTFATVCFALGIRQRFGAVGKYGSIARIERFMRSLKTECTRVIQVPFARKKMLAELLAYVEWFNRHRPHQGLQGRTPDEKYRRVRSKATDSRFEPRAQWPPGSPCAAPRAAVRGKYGAKFILEVTHFQGRRHLPVVALHRVA